ncbi:MAG: flagellar hook assembly protein FlgD [Parvularculaceae bacterium]
MQIQPTIATQTAPASPRTQSQTGAAVDFQSFLRLLTAQLRNQDPLSPLDSTQFVAQLASFSTVEQLVSANDQLGAIANGLSSAGLADYAAWIGRVAEIDGSPTQYEGAATPYRIAQQTGAVRVDLVVRSADGAIVHRDSIRNDESIQYWNGDGARGNGAYSLTIEYIQADGSVDIGAASSFATIDSIRLGADGALITLSNGVTKPAGQIRGLSAAAPSQAASR